jgi:hypothetical protein
MCGVSERERMSVWAGSLTLIALLLSGCASQGPSARSEPSRFAILTLPPPGATEICAAAQIGGTLVTDASTGLALKETSGETVGVHWPFEFAARMDGDRVALVDVHNQALAHVGDDVGLAGGFGNDGRWWTCQFQPIKILASPAAGG